VHQCFERALRPAGSCERDLHVGAEARRRGEQGVEALPRDEAADAEHEWPLLVQTERPAHRGAFGGVDRPEALVINPGRDDDTAQPAACGARRLPRGVPARGDDTRGSAQDARAELAGSEQATRHRDLGAVHHRDIRRAAEARPEVPERQPWVEEDHVGAHFARERVDPLRERSRRQELRLTRADDAKGLPRVPAAIARVARGEHRRVVRRQPAPQLVEVRLDPADLRWEVVRDEQRRHAGQAAVRAYASASSNDACCVIMRRYCINFGGIENPSAPTSRPARPNTATNRRSSSEPCTTAISSSASK
jgi:hypothetical protein